MLAMNDDTLTKGHPMTPELIIETAIDTAEAVTGVSRADILGRSRRHPVVVARWSAMAAARTFGLSLPQIGRGFGRDHTSVLNGLNRVDALDTDGTAERVTETTQRRLTALHGGLR